jgi:hypothetical protein
MDVICGDTGISSETTAPGYFSLDLPASDKRVVLGERWLWWCVAIVAGVLNTWLLIGWREINPLNLSWLAGDAAQHEVGWEFLRHEHVWSFLPTMLTRLDYPTGVSASNLDIIPLVGVLLRPLSPFLPQDFQYLGLYGVLCYVLQTWYGLRLTALFTSDRVVTLLGGLFFLLSPVLTIRMYGHFPHSSHWILLACLYHYFMPRSGSRGLGSSMAPLVVLCVVAAAISPYFAAMAVILAFAALLRAHLEDRRQTMTSVASAATTMASGLPGTSLQSSGWLHTYAFWRVAIPVATLISLALFGFVSVGNFAAGGYTEFSMNLLSPIDPFDKALIFRHIPLIVGQDYEGYNYLGLGVLLLLVIALARKPDVLRRLWSPALMPLVIASAVFTLLALSLKVTLGTHVLFTIPAPHAIFYWLAALRSSGRLFWPVHYLLILGAITGVIVSIGSLTWQRLVLAAALLLQYGDLLPLRTDVAIASTRPHPSPLVSADWNVLPQHHRHLVILPAIQCDPNASPGGLQAWPHFARLVARSDLTLNSAYLGRIGSRALAIDCTLTPKNVLQNGLQPDTAYVLSDAFGVRVLKKPVPYHYCRRVDGFNLCTYNPERARESSALSALLRKTQVRHTT